MPIYEYHCGECGNEFEKLVFNASKKLPALNAKVKKSVG